MLLDEKCLAPQQECPAIRLEQCKHSSLAGSEHPSRWLRPVSLNSYWQPLAEEIRVHLPNGLIPVGEHHCKRIFRRSAGGERRKGKRQCVDPKSRCDI